MGMVAQTRSQDARRLVVKTSTGVGLLRPISLLFGAAAGLFSTDRVFKIGVSAKCFVAVSP